MLNANQLLTGCVESREVHSEFRVDLSSCRNRDIALLNVLLCVKLTIQQRFSRFIVRIFSKIVAPEIYNDINYVDYFGCISDLQVVRYSVFGHYNAHYDTSYGAATKKECCIRKGDIDCHLCRFVSTIKFWNF